MKSDLEELGRRAVACSGWRWMPGMVAIEGARLLSVKDDEWTWSGRSCRLYGYRYLACDTTSPAEIRYLPDFSDPATIGCLLALVRESIGDPGLSVEMDGPELPYWSTWHSSGEMAVGETFESEAGALVATLEAAAMSRCLPRVPEGEGL